MSTTVPNDSVALRLGSGSVVSMDVVFGLGPWSSVVLKDKTGVLGHCLGLQGPVLGSGLGLEA